MNSGKTRCLFSVEPNVAVNEVIEDVEIFRDVVLLPGFVEFEAVNLEITQITEAPPNSGKGEVIFVVPAAVDSKDFKVPTFLSHDLEDLVSHLSRSKAD